MASSRAIREPPAGSSPSGTAPARRPVRTADPGRLEPGRRDPRAGRRPLADAHRRALGGRRAGRALLDPDDHRARRGRGRVGRRGARSSIPAPRPTADRQALFTGTLEVHLGRDAELACRQHPGLRPGPGRRSSTGTPSSARARPPLGAGPARRPARPEPGRQPPRGRSQRRRAGRDRVRRRGPAVRPDLLHPPHRPRHDGQPPVEGRPPRRGADAT